MLASTDLEIDTALLARAVAEVTGHRPRTTWEAVTVRDAATGTPELTEVCSWLPNAADVRFGRQRMGSARVLARVPEAFVQIAAYAEEVNVVVASDDSAHARLLGETILGNVRGPQALPDSVLVSVWSTGDRGPQSGTTRVSVPRWREISQNYPDDTRRRLAELMARTPGDEAPGRLLLFHGRPGTGKTHAIRALMAEWQAWCDPELVVDPEHALFDYTYLDKLLVRKRIGSVCETKRWRLVIAEDADRFLRSHDREAGNEALDRLLNATDGILSQGSKTLFLLTTNVELRTINPALARPGRCLAAISFEEFTHSEAEVWLGDGAPPIDGSKSLAELYELKAGRQNVRQPSPKVFGQYL